MTYSHTNNPLSFIYGDESSVANNLGDMVSRNIQCLEYEGQWNIGQSLEPVYSENNDDERFQYFYHPDHLGSSSFITDMYGYAEQHIQYLPFGELFVNQQNTSFDTRYKFTAKEHDQESNYTYFGARYYDSDLSVWLSVDPMADKYPSLSPYNYCALNPLKYVNPDGMDIDPAAPGYNAAKENATPGHPNYQPAFADLWNKWEKDETISVQFNNNMSESIHSDKGGTVEFGGSFCNEKKV